MNLLHGGTSSRLLQHSHWFPSFLQNLWCPPLESPRSQQPSRPECPLEQLQLLSHTPPKPTLVTTAFQKQQALLFVHNPSFYMHLVPILPYLFFASKVLQLIIFLPLNSFGD
ncbi:hypothetical protein M758_UG109700 [Ceratodon purpureus]|nr:hypothetical protein M758_UG109700 [Ceratodon purpureus]